jgi:hypothetical protein
MNINDDLSNRAEAEMKLHDARMMEQAKLKKLADAPIEERIEYALHRTEMDPELALNYMLDHHMIHPGEHVDSGIINSVMDKLQKG